MAEWEFHDAGGFVPAIFRFELHSRRGPTEVYGQRRYTMYKLCFHTLISLLGDEEHGPVLSIR